MPSVAADSGAACSLIAASHRSSSVSFLKYDVQQSAQPFSNGASVVAVGLSQQSTRNESVNFPLAQFNANHANEPFAATLARLLHALGT